MAEAKEDVATNKEGEMEIEADLTDKAMEGVIQEAKMTEEVGEEDCAMSYETREFADLAKDANFLMI